MIEDELKSKHPLKKLLYGGERPYVKIGGEPSEKRQKFLYVIGQKQRFRIKGYTVEVLAFAGITKQGTVSVLPMFLFTGADEDALWADILNDLASICDFEYLILADYGNEVNRALKALKPDVKHYSIVAYVPQDAFIKYVLETVFREFESQFKSFWWKCGSIEVAEFSEAETIAQTSIKEISEYFEGKIFVKHPEITIDSKSVIGALKSSMMSADGVVYCFVLENSFYVSGDYHRAAVFCKVIEGNVSAVILLSLPDKVSDAVWEDATIKAADKIGDIKYLLYRGCSVNLWTINKTILPNTIWCNSIADIDYNEKSREANLKKFNEIESHLAGVSLDLKSLKEHLAKLGISNIEIV